ncbi:MAG TPA: alanine--glyoxylate aminotransferase family protein [Armatimonadota bacterium]|jgi:aspartate aminotransferase-like enzyme
MIKKPLLMIPGPTPVPPEVLQALSTPMINHRGPAYEELQAELVDQLKYVYQTQGDVIIYPAAGTGAMEAAIANVLSPGDRVLSVSIGVFGDRWAEIARRFGAEVTKHEVPWGRAADPEDVARQIRSDGPFKAVLLTYNETSTGVLNPLEDLAKVARESGALVMVDAISGLLAADLQTDAWGCDVVASGSQKAYMLPPGLSFLSVSQKAWEAHEKATMPRFYWDFTQMRKSMAKNQTPYTPALSLYYGLRVSLRSIREETLQGSFRRHARLAGATRAAAKALGLELFADPAHASPAVTAIKVPEGLTPKEIRGRMLRDFSITLAGGQGKIADAIFRIGHLGYILEPDLVMTFSALERTLESLGRQVDRGAAVAAFQQELASFDKAVTA